MPTTPIAGLTGRTVRCILFDLGDTLWHRKDIASWQHLESVSNQHAISLLHTSIAPRFLPSIADAALGKLLRESLDRYTRNRTRQNPEIEPNGPLAVVQVLKQWGIENVNPAVGEAIFEALRVRIPASRPLFDDVLPTLAELRQRGFLLGIVTNRIWGGQPFQEDLQTLGLLDYFDLRHIAVSGDLGIRKPHSAMFLHVLNACGAAPEHAVMVGDSLRADIVGGQRLGIFSIWKPKPRWPHKIHAGLDLNHTPDELTSDETNDSPPRGLYTTDDDYILAKMRSSDRKPDEYLTGEIQPDLVIENIRDLLDMLPQVGKL